MIKIEVTGTSIGEVADKLLAIGTNLRNGSEVWWEKTDAPQKLKTALQAQLDKELEELEAAQEGPVDPTPAPKSAPAAEEIESQPTTPEPSSTPAPAPSASDELDFDTDVAPFVLQVVKEKGKPVAQEILSQFGVEKASTLDPAQWPELVATLKAAL